VEFSNRLLNISEGPRTEGVKTVTSFRGEGGVIHADKQTNNTHYRRKLK